MQAPSEAEAQCAVLCSADKVYAVSTEDMDVLTFGTKKVARNLMVPAAAKKPILEFDLDKARACMRVFECGQSAGMCSCARA